MERVLLPNQEFNSLDKNRQVILAKSKGNPIVPPSGPSNFPTPPSGGRLSRPVTTPYINPYRVPPRFVDQGLGGAGNPAGAAKFEDQCPAPKKEKSETSNDDYRSRTQKKKKKVTKIENSVITVSLDENGNPIVTIEKKNGEKIVCTYNQALAKYYHADVQGLQFPKGFDRNHASKLAPADRNTYIASTVPREKILEFLKANVRSLSSDSLKAVPGFIGARKNPGTMYLNQNTRELHFVNEGTNEWRTTVTQSEKQFQTLVKNGFHLFPYAGS